MSARSRRATFNLGDSIEVILGVHKGRQGIVRFSGVTQFAKGKWLGVELPVPKGKNDGSVQGVKYFTCKPKHGLFVKPSMVKLVKKGGSSASSSSASASASASAAPASSPTSETTPSSSTPRTRPGLTRQGSRTRTTRSSGPRSGAGTPSSSSRTRASPASSRRPRGEGASSGGAEAEAAPVAAAASGVTARELEEARGEVAEKIAEIEKLEARVSKMQEKLSLVQSTVIELKRSEHAATKKVAELEEKAMEQEAIIETLTVDKDLAEETVEDMKAEMELLKETLETSQLELELQKQEQELNNEEFLQSLDKDDASVARIRLQNEQLTDALRQLRDVSVAEKKRFESTHEASKRKLAELSAEVSHLRDKAARLEKAETDIAELKEQLDAAAEYEQMVEDLSDKIMTIEGENEELSEQVRQLQDLAEANDEIEEGHVEYEKQLQDEIDNYEADVQELKQKLSTSKAKVTDLQKTVNQFRRVTQDLRAQMEALENQASSTESRSKEDLARSRAAFERTLKVQAQIGDLRVKSVEFGLGELEVRQAKRQLDFLRAYIPSNMQVDMRSLNFLSRLDSCDYKCQLLSRLLAQFYGADMATTAGGERDGMMLCEFGCSVAHTLLRLQSALLTLTNKLHVATRENYNGALKRFSMLDSVEFALDTLLQTVGDDKISLSTPVDPLEEAIATVRKFTETYFGEDNVADALPRADSALGVSLSVQRLRFQMIGAKSRLRVIGLYVAQIAGVSDDDSSDGNAEQAQANFDSLEDTHIRTQAAVDSVLDRAAELMLRGKTFSTVPSLKAALNESSSSSDTFIASAEQLEVKANEVISRAAEPTEAAPEVAHVIELHGTATREALQAVQASLETLVQELDSRIAEADRAASSGPSSPKAAGGSAAAIWEKHAEETRKELEAAATLKDELERNKSAIEAKAQELAAANKRAREHQKQMDMLTQRLQLVEQRAGTSTQLEADLKRLKEQENEHRELLDTLQSDIEKYTTENKTLKTDLATAQLQQARGVPNGLASGGRSAAFAASASGAPDASASSSVSSAEVLVLRRTVGLLRKQIAALRSEKAVRELEQSLPPLNTRRTRIRPRGMYTEAQFAAIEAMERRVSHAEEKRQKQLHVYRENLKKYAHQSRRLRSAPVLVNLAKVDPADPATASAASAKFFSRRSKLEAVSAKVRGLKNAFLSALGADVEHLDANRGKIAESGEVPVPVGRIRVPRAAAEAAGATLASQRLEVGKKELAQLQAIFV